MAFKVLVRRLRSTHHRNSVAGAGVFEGVTEIRRVHEEHHEKVADPGRADNLA
jgi:hypothetical protein